MKFTHRSVGKRKGVGPGFSLDKQVKPSRKKPSRKKGRLAAGVKVQERLPNRPRMAMAAPIDVDRVTQLLGQSHVAHERAKQARRRQSADASAHLVEARDRRLEAHALDPLHTAPAWVAEQPKTPTGRDTHTEMLAFYDEQLGELS